MSYDETLNVTLSADYKSRLAISEGYFNKQFACLCFQKKRESLYAVTENAFGYGLLEIKNKPRQPIIQDSATAPSSTGSGTAG